MKIKFKKFEMVARHNGYKNGAELFEAAGGYLSTYKMLKTNMQIGYEIVKELYNIVGESDLSEIIDWEGETLNGFISKFVKVENILY